ncbi:MAG: glutamate racemase [Bacillota bacterium]|nr:glutamate racemase [Bacillota bacterium]MDI9415922.1 glutamate racemase [Bacillota bacterium]NLD12961.1 glutamate racemase [Bacillota bacterium]HOB88847.1 glutamate racemase [Bacillota bacterium]HOJ58023.1 glutamate racemase [Bacillota bacterium]
MSSQPIGVYDSGVGGLSVVKEISSKLPWERVAYFGDTARVPYGEKRAQEILELSREAFRFLIAQGSKYIIVACNTVCSQVLEDVKKEFGIPVMGILQPGAYAASRATATGRIGVLATTGTIRSGAYEKAITQYLSEAQVFGVACPRLAPLVEEGNIDTAETRNALRGYIGPLLEKDIDTLVLGCSHYAHLNEHIRRIVGPGIEIVDPAVETVTATAIALQELGLQSQERVGEHEFIVTGDPACFLAVARRLLGDDLTKVGRVEVSPI